MQQVGGDEIDYNIVGLVWRITFHQHGVCKRGESWINNFHSSSSEWNGWDLEEFLKFIVGSYGTFNAKRDVDYSTACAWTSIRRFHAGSCSMEIANNFEFTCLLIDWKCNKICEWNLNKSSSELDWLKIWNWNDAGIANDFDNEMKINRMTTFQFIPFEWKCGASHFILEINFLLPLINFLSIHESLQMS